MGAGGAGRHRWCSRELGIGTSTNPWPSATHGGAGSNHWQKRSLDPPAVSTHFPRVKGSGCTGFQVRKWALTREVVGVRPRFKGRKRPKSAPFGGKWQFASTAAPYSSPNSAEDRSPVIHSASSPAGSVLQRTTEVDGCHMSQSSDRSRRGSGYGKQPEPSLVTHATDGGEVHFLCHCWFLTPLSRHFVRVFGFGCLHD